LEYYGTQAGNIMSLTFCTFDGCGLVQHTINMHANATYIVEDCNFQNSQHSTYSIQFDPTNAIGSGTRSVQRNAFDKRIFAESSQDMTIKDNFMGEAISPAGNTTPAEASGNIVWKTSNTAVNLRGDWTDNLFVTESTSANPHHVQTAPTGNQVLHGNVFHFTGTQTDGDCILINAATGTSDTDITNNIVTTNGGGGPSGTLLSALGVANTTFSADHNTYQISSAGGGIAISETFTGFANMCTSVRSNLAWSADSTGYIIQDSATNDAVADYVTVASHNARTTADGSYETDAGVITSAGSSDQVDILPDFVDSSRTVASWDALLGGPGTAANASAELAKLNTPEHDANYAVADLIAYLKAGFVPQLQTLIAAGHDSADIGAMPVQAEPAVDEPQKPIEYYLKVFRKNKRSQF
jgi:hypothetical protein